MVKKGTASAGGHNTAAVVEALIRPTVEAQGVHLWDVRFEKEGPDWFLRVLIDGEGRMDTDTCEKVSRAIDPILDEHDPISQGYYLEVGSPGLGRKLTRPEHIVACTGQTCLAHLIRPDEAGRREVRGTLQGLDEAGNVTLQQEGESISFPLSAASYLKLCDDEDLFKD